ncbi:MAG TPA: hypothetical protein VFO41_02865 [Alphaproteobacteria bacterium]|nr:hypothetical protein [Alphaproteobacteria bacterium]
MDPVAASGLPPITEPANAEEAAMIEMVISGGGAVMQMVLMPLLNDLVLSEALSGE